MFSGVLHSKKGTAAQLGHCSERSACRRSVHICLASVGERRVGLRAPVCWCGLLCWCLLVKVRNYDGALFCLTAISPRRLHHRQEMQFSGCTWRYECLTLVFCAIPTEQPHPGLTNLLPGLLAILATESWHRRQQADVPVSPGFELLRIVRAPRSVAANQSAGVEPIPCHSPNLCQKPTLPSHSTVCAPKCIAVTPTCEHNPIIGPAFGMRRS